MTRFSLVITSRTYSEEAEGSFGQYLDGTTDITRTVALGEQPDERKDRFTRVLQGHIALASAVFPPDTSGYQLDILARQPLWNAGLDYAHGTGHGVGTYLGVHEGPQSVAKKAPWVPLRPGMILSNEPGYYVEGEYGIRIENLVVVRDSASAGMLEFETLTLFGSNLALKSWEDVAEMDRLCDDIGLDTIETGAAVGSDLAELGERLAELLASRVTPTPWQHFTTCPREDLRHPQRVHVDPFGHLHICQGISIGNLLERPLTEIMADFRPDEHPIVGPLLDGGPAEIVRRYKLAHEDGYADHCHLCYVSRQSLRSRFPDVLAPDQMYGRA